MDGIDAETAWLQIHLETGKSDYLLTKKGNHLSHTALKLKPMCWTQTTNGKIKSQFGANELFRIFILISSIANSGGHLLNKDMSSSIPDQISITLLKSTKHMLAWQE